MISTTLAAVSFPYGSLKLVMNWFATATASEYRNGGQRDGGYRCLPALLEMSPSDPKPHTEN